MNLFRYFIATITFISLFCQGISCNPMAENPSLQAEKAYGTNSQEKKENSLVWPLLILGASCLMIISTVSEYEYGNRLEKKIDRLWEERKQQVNDMKSNNKIINERTSEQREVSKAVASDADALERLVARMTKELEVLKEQRLRNQ